MNIPQLNLTNQYHSIKKEIDLAIESVLESGTVINGKNVAKIEKSIATYSGAKYGIGVANGSDALFIALKALGIGRGDSVITTPFTFFATAGSIARAGATPIFVDIESDTYNIDPKKLREYIHYNCRFYGNQLTGKQTGIPIKAIIPVHLFGQMCKMDEIMKIAKKYNLKVIEDSAQAIGSEYKGKKAGSYGDLATFSFFPTKNLGTYGDGGMIITSNPKYVEYCRVFRSHGADPKYYHKLVGINSRLDEIHAAVLNVKFKYLDTWLEDRFKVALRYLKLFRVNYDLSELPLSVYYSHSNHQEHTFNQYIIYAKDRDKLREHLKRNGIGTSIYYPLCLHLQECFKYLGYKVGDFPVAENASKHVLALPMYPELTEREQEYIVSKINEFYCKEYNA
ncbi:MAG: DegT/DnrJ/EryC1/StrS family aminotransferase [Candidatus Marinimicrobia bacterium]|nr:DegT/DnrJ/EryC1/StrS family aminotransferase [Candidatus Neomarinimicrobiota bacterium]